MNIHQRLKAARLKAGLSTVELAARLDVTPQTISAWESGKGPKPKMDRLPEVATALGVTQEWLLTGNDAKVGLGDKYVFVRRYQRKRQPGGTKVNSHVSIAHRDNDDDTYAFRRSYFEQKGIDPLGCFVIDAFDDSMVPVITNDSIALVNTADRAIIDGELYAFETDGPLLVRRCYMRPDRVVILKPENATFPVYEFPLEQLDIIGRIIHIGVNLI